MTVDAIAFSTDVANGDTAPSLEHVVLNDRTANLATELHELLSEAVMASGTLPLKAAAALLKEDPLFGKAKAADLTLQLIEQFECPVQHQGVTLVVEGRGKARHLTGWRDDEKADAG